MTEKREGSSDVPRADETDRRDAVRDHDELEHDRGHAGQVREALSRVPLGVAGRKAPPRPVDSTAGGGVLGVC